MQFRKVDKAYHAPEIMMGENKLRQAIPLNGLQQISPFILLHHFDMTIEANGKGLNVPPHPHRGFSPITFMFEGSVAHRDSLGNEHEIHSNEVQWINASRGIIHSEVSGKEMLETGGRFQGIQLWINLKAEDKMKTPAYQAITQNEMVLIEEPGIAFRLVSGTYAGRRGPAPSNTLTAMLRMDNHSVFHVELPANENVLFYILEGRVTVNGDTQYAQHQLVHFQMGEGKIELKALSETKILFMSGIPIDEPLVTYGPFVMNSQTEILEAMRDYQEGKMGFLY